MLTDTEVNLAVSSFAIVSIKGIQELIIPLRKLGVEQFTSLSDGLEDYTLLVFPRGSVFFLLDLIQKKEQGTTKWLSM
jgi:hypothetical protein